nr:helix-turn-helix domain-containing protein [Veillonella denticariosi]
MNKTERLKAIAYLNDKGAFLISKSSEKIAEYFNISKFTLYSDLNAVKEES